MKRTVSGWSAMLMCIVAMGCGGEGGDDASTTDTGPADFVPPDPVPVTEPPPPDISALPVDEAGDPVLIATETVHIGLDPEQRGPTSALAACMAVVERCWVEQGLDADNRVVVMDLCERSAPTCATDEPWNEAPCCPAACWDRYEAARRAGRDPVDAEEEVYFGADPCVVGVPPTSGGGAP